MAIAHIGYLYIKGTARKPHVITLDEFRTQAKWIPKALIVNGERREITSDVNVSREKAEEHAATGTERPRRWSRSNTECPRSPTSPPGSSCTWCISRSSSRPCCSLSPDSHGKSKMATAEADLRDTR